MKRVTATAARRGWFRLLDEVVDGEVVVVERRGHRIVLRRSDPDSEPDRRVPSYEGLIRMADVDRADEWGWEWRGRGALVPGSSRSR